MSVPPPRDPTGSTGPDDDLDRSGDVIELPVRSHAPDAPPPSSAWWQAAPEDSRSRLAATGAVLLDRLRGWFHAVAASWGKTEREALDRIGEVVGGLIGLCVFGWAGWKAIGWAAPTVSSWWDSGLQAAGVGSGAHNPVKAYLAAHSAGLPWDGTTLLHAWVVTGVVVWALAVLRIRAAQLGWLGYVAATAAMAYAGTRGSGAAITAGIVVTAAVALSIPVARRGVDPGPEIVLVPADTARHATRGSGQDAA